jgi:hypothetical protein
LGSVSTWCAHGLETADELFLGDLHARGHRESGYTSGNLVLLHLQVGSIMINLGTNVMKMGHNKLAAFPSSSARPKPAIQ